VPSYYGIRDWRKPKENKYELKYREYLNSAEWKAKATAAKIRAGWRCQICNRKGNEKTLHAHHRTYERLGKELNSDITVLCNRCHCLFHNVELAE
jgi:5-methylcytosine-specific restriction endonuclease McrA